MMIASRVCYVLGAMLIWAMCVQCVLLWRQKAKGLIPVRRHPKTSSRTRAWLQQNSTSLSILFCGYLGLLLMSVSTGLWQGGWTWWITTAVCLPFILIAALVALAIAALMGYLLILDPIRTMVRNRNPRWWIWGYLAFLAGVCVMIGNLLWLEKRTTDVLLVTVIVSGLCGYIATSKSLLAKSMQLAAAATLIGFLQFDGGPLPDLPTLTGMPEWFGPFKVAWLYVIVATTMFSAAVFEQAPRNNATA